MEEEEQQQHHMHSCSINSNKKFLKERSTRDLVADKRRLVEVPYTASISDTINVLVANGVSAVPVAAPPGHWIGAGGSMILESEKATGAIRKHYIGIVAILDVLIHIADEEAASVLDNLVSLPVSSIIGHCSAGLSLWTLNPDTSILDCMEVFSKGIHRALIPVDSHMKHVGVELADASPGYRMLSQMDVLRDLKAHDTELKDIMSCIVRELGAINENVYCVT